MEEWVEAFYELGKSQGIPINLRWEEEVGNQGAKVQTNALKWAIQTRSEKLTSDQLARLVDGATTVDATAGIFQSTLRDVYSSFPAVFSKLMDSGMLIAPFGNAFVAAKVFETETFLVGADSNDITWDQKPHSKVIKLWNSITGRRLEAETKHGKKEAEIEAESSFVMVKDIAQVGMRGIIRYLLMLDAPAEIFKTDILTWTITEKWNAYGRAMCVADMIAYFIFLVCFFAYALLLARKDAYGKDDKLEGALIAIPLLISLLFVLSNVKGEWIQIRRYMKDALETSGNRRDGWKHYAKSQWNWIEMISYVFLFLVPPLHVLTLFGWDLDRQLSVLVAIASLLLWFKVCNRIQSNVRR